MNHLLSISAMPAYRNVAVEQIRLRDYIAAGKLNSEGLYPDLAANAEPSSIVPQAATSQPSSSPNSAKQSSAPSPPDPVTADGSTNFPPEKYAADVLAFYERHNPSKIPDIPSILRKYEGREELLLQKLDKKYASSAPSSGGVLSPGSDVDSVPKADKEPSGEGESAG